MLAWFIAALTDWLGAIGGTNPLIEVDADFPDPDDWRRLLRLAVFVLALSGVDVAVQSLLTGAVSLADLWRYLRLPILGTALFAVVYFYGGARPCGVVVTVSRVFFTALILTIPWLPIIMLINSATRQNPMFVYVTIIAFWLILALVMRRFEQTIEVLSPGTSKVRVWLSIAMTVIAAGLVAGPAVWFSF